MGVLDGKVAIVTGSARGIGRATAELLAEHGASVLINDLDGDLARQAASEIGGDTLVHTGDLTAVGACDALVQAAIDGWGKLDIIVNNAGYTIDGMVHKMTDEQFQRMLDIHAVVPFRVCRAAAPYLREPAKKEREEGVEVFRKIVNVSSISGTMGNAGQANYAAGKAAVVGPDEDAGEGVGPVQDQRQRGRVRLHRHAPDGRRRTRTTRSRSAARPSSSASPSSCAACRPSSSRSGGRARREEAAGGVFFLCSPWSNYVHGQTLNVTGGQFTGMTT